MTNSYHLATVDDAFKRLRNKAPWFKVINAAKPSDPVEILIYADIGKSWWSDDGVGAKDFADALKLIPLESEIVVGINSRGGNVFDGLAIYNLLQMRGAKVRTRVDGMAASIASVIACAGRSCEMPANAMLMIHDPSGIVEGTAEDMRKIAEALDKAKLSIASVYQARTGKSFEEISRAMTDETWMTADDAVAFGLCQVKTPAMQLAAQSAFDLSCFRHAPGAFQQQKQNHDMNRTQLIALLKRLGIKFSDSATDDQLRALLAEAAADPGAPTPASAPTTNAAPASPPAPAPAPAPANFGDAAAMQARISALEAANDRERRDRITRTVDELVASDRIPRIQAAAWVTRAMADETILDSLRQLPERPPGAEPVAAGIETVNASPSDIVDHLGRLRVTAGYSGSGAFNPGLIARSARSIATIYAANRDRIIPFLNANTIDSALQRNLILQEMIRAFRKRLIPVNAFARVYMSVPLQGTDKVEVPYYALDTVASTDWVAGNGYVTENTSTSKKEITINKRKYKGLSFGSDEFRRQPFLNLAQLMTLKAEQLGVDVFTDILSVVTASAYGAAVTAQPAEAYDSDDVADMRTACNVANWPQAGRSLILDSAYDGNLFKDPSIKNALNYGGTEASRAGQLATPFYGFDQYYQSPNIPTNSENLKGFAVWQSAILVATAPIQPSDLVRSQLVRYELAMDPESGITLEYRAWGDADYDKGKEVVECNYGYAAGEATALKRITSA